ncbi:MAG: FixH family protein [Pseudomonadota bacterium]
MSTNTLTARERQRPDSDEVAWYRQFWPWFLIALPGTVVAASISMIFVANEHADDLVVKDYYKDGLGINRELARRANAKTLDMQAHLSVLDQRLQVRLSGELDPASLAVSLYHPLEADQDFAAELERIAPGLYLADLQRPVDANWHWVLTDPDQQDWRLDGSLSADNMLAY